MEKVLSRSEKRHLQLLLLFQTKRKKGTPLAHNKCHDCEGEVVKKVSSLYGGKFYYDTPRCNKCGRVYSYAEDARLVGREEFLKRLDMPFTI